METFAKGEQERVKKETGQGAGESQAEGRQMERESR